MNKLITVALFLFFSTFVNAQSYRNAPLYSNSNYFDIVANERAKLSALKNSSDRKSKKKIKQFERWAAFWKDRIFEDGSFVPQGFILNEIEKDINKQNRLKLKSGNNVSEAWTLIGPTTQPQTSISFYPGMGRINTVAFSGTNTDTLFIGSPSGGIWKSTDGGTRWVAKGDNLPNMGVSHIVIDPNDRNIIYIATGDYDGGQNRSLGVYKSTNGGDSWTQTGLSFGLEENNIISKLLIDPNNTNTIFATTLHSIKRSTDAGNSWSDVYTENTALFNDITYKVGSNTILYATSQTGKFYISTDNGSTWSVASSPATGRLDLALTANDVNQIITLDDGGVIRKSTDNGSSWTTVSTISAFDPQGGYNMSIAVSPVDKNLILVGGVDGWRSTDGGVNWEKYLDGYWEEGNPYFYVHSDHHDIIFIPNSNIAFSVNDGGIFKGDASGNTAWTDLSSGLAITQYYSVSGTPQDENLLISGAQDNDISRYDGTKFIGENPGSDGVEGLWDYSDSKIAWTCSQSGALYRTTDGFATTVEITTPGAPFVWELEIHPTDPKTIYGGFFDIYKSTDRGDNWTNLNSNVGDVEFISIAPSNPDVIYVSGTNGVKKTTNGGTSWTDISLPQDGNVKSIEVHPTNPDEVYLAYSGYLSGKVYKSTDGGSSFTDITGSLPNVPTHKIVYETGSTDGELYLATDLGVYYRTNSVGDWVKLDAGLPNVIVHDIEIHYGAGKIRVATFGRGIWERSITTTPTGFKDNLLSEDFLYLYPNPATDKRFTIETKVSKGKSKILIYNTIGTVIKQIETSESKINVDLSGFSNGVYIVKIINNGKNITKKIILK